MKIPVRSMKRQVLGVFNYAGRGISLALGVIGAGLGLQLLLGDITAWAFIGLLIVAVFMLARKPDRTMGPALPQKVKAPTECL